MNLNLIKYFNSYSDKSYPLNQPDLSVKLELVRSIKLMNIFLYVLWEKIRIKNE